jgi:hypothetical protein
VLFGAEPDWRRLMGRIPGGAGLRTGVSRVSLGWGLFLVFAAAAVLMGLIAMFYNVDGAPDARGPANPRARRAK